MTTICSLLTKNIDLVLEAYNVNEQGNLVEADKKKVAEADEVFHQFFAKSMNKMFGTDITVGCDTAINVTLEAIDRLRTTGSSHNRAFLVETMGRDCGYLAIMAGLAGGAEVISIPEFEVSASEIAQRLRAAFERGKTHAIVVIAEGVKENAAKILAYFDADKQRAGFELRATTLGHVVRGAPPSAFDRLLATRLGVSAVKSLSDGETGVLVGYQKNEVTRTPLADIVGRVKPVDTELVELARILAK